MNAPAVSTLYRNQLQGVSTWIAAEFDHLAASINQALSTLAAAVTALIPIQTGMIIVWSGSIVPAGYLKCDGTAYSRVFYGKLFNVTSTTYGAGDGSTTFNVPNIAAVVAGSMYVIKT